MSTVDAIIIKLKRVQRDIVRTQAAVAFWDGNQSNGEVKTVADQVKAYQKKVEDLRDSFDEKANADQITAHDPTFDTICQSLSHLTTAVNDVSLLRIQTKPIETFKFEKLKLPTFSGDLSEWQQFADLFKSAIHNNGSMSGAVKMIHLKDALKGDAATIIQNTASTDLGYTEAWGKVEARYSNQREIVFCHLRKLYDFQPQKDSSLGLREVCDTVNECVRALKLQKIEVDKWDVIMVFLSLTKVAEETKKQWLLTQGHNLPVLAELLDYLEKRATALSESPKLSTSKSKEKSNDPPSSSHHGSTQSNQIQCLCCTKQHAIWKCPEFHALSPQGRSSFLKKDEVKTKACYNCLGSHIVDNCKSDKRCQQCNGKHHSLLHFDRKNQSSSQRQSSQSKATLSGSGSQTKTPADSAGSSKEVVNSSHASSFFPVNRIPLLATLVVNVKDKYGEFIQCRVFLDPGSDADFISENLVSRLSLRRQRVCVRVNGIGGSWSGTARGMTTFNAHSKFNNFALKVKALIIPKVTGGRLPRQKCIGDFPHLVGLNLSDPDFNSPSSVDILLGTDSANEILLQGLRQGPPKTPHAQNSQFGWYVSGSAPTAIPTIKTFTVKVHHSACSPSDPCLESSLRRFWELEDPTPLSSQLSTEDTLCEKYFLQTFNRDSEGRYEVSLPFSPDIEELGESRQRSISCFKSLERQFQKDPKLKEAYHSQIQSYVEKNWVELIPPSEKSNSLRIPITTTGDNKLSLIPNYIPHHVVVKPDNTTTQFRIVFNASAKTTSGNSLNSILLAGPKIQTDLHPLLTRFRSHPIAIAADIVKFYHQVKVNPLHTDFQRFVWRENPWDDFTDFRFLRLLFGVRSAPYLAIRALRQLGEDSKDAFPLAYDSICNDFLVDNLLTGASTLEEAMEVKAQVTEVLNQGRFPLQKWASNHPDILSSIPTNEREDFSLNIQDDESIKTIGLFWHPMTDTFGVKIESTLPLTSATQREVLSHTARIFDPLQWLSPVTITPKILLQLVWKEKIGWDDPIPDPIFKKWNKYRSELELLRQFRIPRCFTFPTSAEPPIHNELIGFCDASNAAYSACVYLRSKSNDGEIKVELIGAKTKVAPVRGETTPRLELCGAVLLSSFANSMVTTLSPTKIHINSISCYSDSTGVLGQIFSTEKQPVFVANRIRKIRNSSALIHWFHVPGEQNPADCASRGISASNFLNHPLWLHGPPFLLTDEIPPQPYSQTVASFVVGVDQGLSFVNSKLTDLIANNSSFPKMKRLVAYWIRFIHNSRKPQFPSTGPLTASELNLALIPIVKCVQMSSFPEEIQRCEEGIVKGQFRFLSPFLDKNGILRVGGRIQQAELSFSNRHPILLPKYHSRPTNPEQKIFGHFSSSVVRHYHETNLHAAPKLLLALVRSEFWISRGQNLCSRIFRNCLPCFKQNPKPSFQLMGQLPHPRVSLDFPFIKVGLDYAGPFELAVTPGRNPKIIKSYVCVFTCMATKAVHLEYSGGLSTPDFISAFQRFCAIRNSPSDIFCDRGTNFRGASTAMDDLQALLDSPDHQQKVALFFSGEKINYHFNPPRGPHHGGLWEAAVKSMKLHLFRVTQGHHVSIEEFITLLARISAALNSRPLTPLSNSPDDFEVLTPFHFLTMRAPKFVPEVDVTSAKSHRTRWHRVQQMSQHFFRRWNSDYLQSLQQKHKWLKPQQNISKGTMVLLQESDSPLGHQPWQLGRIEETFPGKDGRVRICDVRIPSPGCKPMNYKIFRRPITSLAPLPMDDDVNSAYISVSSCNN